MELHRPSLTGSCLIGLVLLLIVGATPSFAQSGAATEDDDDEILQHVSGRWTGDLDGIVDRGFIRILTVHNPLLFTFAGVDQRGLVVDMAKAFEEQIGRAS